MQENAQSQKQNYDVIIPTYKPDEKCKRLLDALEKQEVPPRKIILINTEEALFPKSLLEGRNPELYLLKHIKKEEFDHAYARNLGVSFSDAPFFLCMTEDAVPKDSSCTKELLEAFLGRRKSGRFTQDSLPTRKAPLTRCFPGALTMEQSRRFAA